MKAAAIIVLSPVMLGTALLVRIKLGSPALFTQERPGMIANGGYDIKNRGKEMAEVLSIN